MMLGLLLSCFIESISAFERILFETFNIHIPFYYCYDTQRFIVINVYALSRHEYSLVLG